MQWLYRLFIDGGAKPQQSEEASNSSDRLLDKYLEAVRKEFPLWFNSRLNPTQPRDRFFEDFASFAETFKQRKQGASQEEITKAYEHLLDNWPGGLLGYNSWYVIGTARSMGLLDESFAPVLGAKPINEEARRMQELRELGGDEAIAACNRAMNP